MTEKRKLLRAGDIIIIVLLLGAALAAILLSGGKDSGNAGAAVITLDGEVIARIALDRDGSCSYAKLPGVVFTVEDGSVRISENDCAGKVCMRTGKISRKGEVIICMPKKIVVEIDGEPELDAVMK